MTDRLPPARPHPGHRLAEELVDWFLCEIGDRPMPANPESGLPGVANRPGVDDLRYALASLGPATGLQGTPLLTWLREALATGPNLDCLLSARTTRRSGGFEPYFLELQRPDVNTIGVTVLPRPLFTADAALSGVSAALLVDGNPAGLPGQDNLAPPVLDRERSRLFRVLDRMPAYVCLLASDHSIRYANSCFRQEFGKIENRSCYELMHRSATPCALCPAMEILDTRSTGVWEWECAASGKTFLAYAYPFDDVNGVPLVLELGLDITPTKRAQQALRLSEERYRSITENLAIGVALVDRDRRVLAVNPRLSAWFGHPEQLPAEGLCCDLFPCRGDCEHRPCRQTFEQGAVVEDRLELPSPGGTQTFQLTFCPVRGADRVESMLVMVDDVTEKLLVQNRLQRAQRLESLGTLAAGIAHEINQPLNALQLYVGGLEMLVERRPELDRTTILERLGLILDQCRRICDIITHMRALSRQQNTVPPQPVDVNRVVENALELLKSQLAAHGITLRFDLMPDLPDALATPVQLEQVIINLTVNAMQSLDAFDNRERPGKYILLRTTATRERVFLEVEDNGAGLAGIEDRIFDPLFSEQRSGMGTGLGLPIVHTLVSSWSGEISGRCNDGPGATFLVSLLRASAEPDA